MINVDTVQVDDDQSIFNGGDCVRPCVLRSLLFQEALRGLRGFEDDWLLNLADALELVAQQCQEKAA